MKKGDKGKIKDGINILNDVLLQSPNDWKVYYNLGQAYKIDGNIDKAIELLDKAKTLDNEGYLCNYFGPSIVTLIFIDFKMYGKLLRKIKKKTKQKRNLVHL